MEPKPEQKLITISIGEEEITFDEKKPEPESSSVKKTVQLVPVEVSPFKFDFKGLITDKFVVKKIHDPAQGCQIIEIWLERGLPDKLERTPLVKLTTFQ